jgi:hypothetical protein
MRCEVEIIVTLECGPLTVMHRRHSAPTGLKSGHNYSGIENHSYAVLERSRWLSSSIESFYGLVICFFVKIHQKIKFFEGGMGQNGNLWEPEFIITFGLFEGEKSQFFDIFKFDSLPASASLCLFLSTVLSRRQK